MINMPWRSALADDPILLADAIELYVAFDPDFAGRFSRADFQHLITTESLNEDDQTFLIGEAADDFMDEFEQAIELIQNRLHWMGASYPFEVIDGDVLLKRERSDHLTLPYLFMLICTNDDCTPDLSDGLPLQFEYLCKEALLALFPKWAKVLMFGNRSEDRRAIFGYQAKRAIPVLAKMLNAKLDDEHLLGEGGNEFGIDIVAICPLGDEASYPFFAFAQCTIGGEWWEKRYESKAQNQLKAFVKLNADHSNLLMIPHLPRYSLDCWSEKPNLTGDCILFDRLRICDMLVKSKTFEKPEWPDAIAEVFVTLATNLVTIHD